MNKSMKSATKGITPDKAKRRPNTWQPSPVKKAPMPSQKNNYRPQGK